MVDFLFALIELFSLSITVPGPSGDMCIAWLFSQGSACLHSNFVPSITFGARKLETLGYLMVKTASFCTPSFWHNTRVWPTNRQTDGRICTSIYSNC